MPSSTGKRPWPRWLGPFTTADRPFLHPMTALLPSSRLYLIPCLMSFSLEPTQDPGTVIVRIGKVLDFRNAAEFKKICQEQSRAGADNFILDFSGTELLDSVGLGAIFSLYRQVTPANGEVVFAAVSNPVQVMVRLTKIFRVFPQYTTIEDACRALHTSP